MIMALRAALQSLGPGSASRVRQAEPPGEPLFVYERLLVHDSGTRAAHRMYLPFATCLDTPLEADPFRPSAAIYAVLADAATSFAGEITRPRACPRLTTPPRSTSAKVSPCSSTDA